MSKIQLCPKCNCLTEHVCKGSIDERSGSEKEMDRIASVATLGAYVLVNKVLGKPRRKYYKCTRCGCISIH